MKVHAHAGFRGILAAGRDTSSGSPRGMHGGLFEFLPLRHADDQRAEKKEGKLRLHRASLIITSRLSRAWLIMVQWIWIPKIEKAVSSACVQATMNRCFFVPAAIRA